MVLCVWVNSLSSPPIFFNVWSLKEKLSVGHLHSMCFVCFLLFFSLSKLRCMFSFLSHRTHALFTFSSLQKFLVRSSSRFSHACNKFLVRPINASYVFQKYFIYPIDDWQVVKLLVLLEKSQTVRPNACISKFWLILWQPATANLCWLDIQNPKRWTKVNGIFAQQNVI